MTDIEFMLAAQKVGVDNYLSSLFLVAPSQLGQRMLEAAKRLARFLKYAEPTLGHRKKLEVVAQSAGFPNWHAFHALCQNLIDDYAEPGSGRRGVAFAPFVPALPLLIIIGDETPPLPEETTGLESLGGRLAIALGQPVPKMLDVLAKFHGADTWRVLCDRKPEDSTGPLYVFRANQESGQFHWSPACTAMVEGMDELWQDYDRLSKPKQTKARQYVAQLVRKRPDFLEGRLALATMTSLDGAPEKEGPILAQAIKDADRLIPPKFDGEICWGHLSNRFYHRLLFAHMRWCATFGSMEEAIALAQRQLRLNHSDNLGVRISLPAFLAASGDHDAAKVALRRISDPEVAQDGHILLVRSLCHLLAGEMEEGKELFLRALFKFPALRPLILEHEAPDVYGQSKKWLRGCLPDLEMVWFDYCTACNDNEEHTEEVFVRILLNPAVIAVEEELASLYVRARASPSNGSRPHPIQQWADAVEQAAISLAALA